MAKDPAFLFYPGDWISGTMYFTFEQKGAYFELLMLQFNMGRFREENAKHILNSNFDTLWPVLKVKFRFENGVYWNEKLEFEKEKRKSFCNSRKENKLSTYDKSYYATYDKTSDEHMMLHMENENIIDNKVIKEISIEPRAKKFVPPTLSEVQQYFADNLYSENSAIAAHEYYTERNWHDKEGTPVINWKMKCRTNWFKEKDKIDPPPVNCDTEEFRKLFGKPRLPFS